MAQPATAVDGDAADLEQNGRAALEAFGQDLREVMEEALITQKLLLAIILFMRRRGGIIDNEIPEIFQAAINLSRSRAAVTEEEVILEQRLRGRLSALEFSLTAACKGPASLQ